MHQLGMCIERRISKNRQVKPTKPSKDYALLFDHLKSGQEAVCISYERDPDNKKIVIQHVEVWAENSLDTEEDAFKERCRILDVEFVLISRFDDEEVSPTDLPEKVVEEIMLLEDKAIKYASGEKLFPWSVVRDQLSVTCEAISAYRRARNKSGSSTKEQEK